MLLSGNQTKFARVMTHGRMEGRIGGGVEKQYWKIRKGRWRRKKEKRRTGKKWEKDIVKEESDKEMEERRTCVKGIKRRRLKRLGKGERCGQ